MAGSLLRTIGLPELITTSLADYEEMAVRLAAATEQLSEIRQRLADNRLSSPLFDTPRFVRALDDLLESVALRP